MLDGVVERVDHRRRGLPAARREDARALRARTQLLGQHGLDLDQRGTRALGQARAGEGAHEARADDQRFEFAGIEHQRRDVRALAQDIADPGFALDRHAGQLQVGDVAVDRAQRDRETRGQLPRGQRRTPPAQGMDDEEKAVGTAHAGIIAVRPAAANGASLRGRHFGDHRPTRLPSQSMNWAK